MPDGDARNKPVLSIASPRSKSIPLRGEVRKSGIRIRVQEQPLKLLAALFLERPGELITREELHRRLWPEDTFVDFEHGLNAAATRLRQALGDAAQNPRFIESVPRRGYRFISQVERIQAPGQASSPVPAMAPRSRARLRTRRTLMTRTFDQFYRTPGIRFERRAYRQRWSGSVWLWWWSWERSTNLSINAPHRAQLPRFVSPEPPEETTFAEFDSTAVSPDGLMLCLYRDRPLRGVRHLWVRAFDNPRSRGGWRRPRGPSFFSWSPDSRSVACSSLCRASWNVWMSQAGSRESCAMRPMDAAEPGIASGASSLRPLLDAPLFQTSLTGSTPRPLTSLDNSRD